MLNEILKNLLTSAILSDARDMDNNEVIDICIADNEYKIGALCMDINGDIHFFRAVEPTRPLWFTRNIRDIASEQELSALYKALKRLNRGLK